METVASRWTLGELARLLGGEVDGPEDLPIDRPVAADEGDPRGIAFAENDLYMQRAKRSGVGAVLITSETDCLSVPAIRVKKPKEAFGVLLFLSARPLPINEGVHPTAQVHASAKVAPDACIGPFCVIEAGASIGERAKIYANCYVGENCIVGDGSVLYPGVVLYQDVKVGTNCILHSGCVLGADGFGFIWDGAKRVKIPQIGSLSIGNSVEIGANTTLDRATVGTTEVGDGTKLDNLVQIGHNCRIGDHCVLAGQTGISGSTVIGDRVVMGGGVGVKDHVTIADDVKLGGRSGVDRDIREPGEYFGTPARVASEAVRAFLLAPKLPELFSRLRAIEKKLESLDPEA